MKILNHFGLILILIFAVGCGKSHKENSQSSLVRSYKLIDENRMDEAISFLTEEITRKSNPDIPDTEEVKQLKVCLASAYAKKAGITIREAFKIYEVSQKISKIGIVNGKKERKKLNAQERFLKDLSRVLLTTLKMSETMASIASVPKEKAPFLLQAVRILSSTTNLSPADSIYSAFVKFILVRSYLGSDELKYTLPEAVEENGQCVAKVNEFRDHLVRVSKILISAFDDLGKALPKQKKAMEKSSKDITELVTNISSANFAVVTLYNIDTSMVDEIYQNLGLGSHKLSCGSDETHPQ